MDNRRGICQCGNPTPHPQQPRPAGAADGRYCWSEPARRPDGARLLFPSLPDGYVPPVPDGGQAAAARREYEDDLGRLAAEWAAAVTPAGNRFRMEHPPERDDYRSFRAWRDDCMRWRRLRGWAAAERNRGGGGSDPAG